MFVLILGLLMSVWPGVSLTVGAGQRGRGGGYADMDEACRNSRRGSSFQPQVSFCYLDYI